ncbi:hypothetical protein PTKIN_Ptkin11bG0123600 [Pterospermum kingtungense]
MDMDTSTLPQHVEAHVSTLARSNSSSNKEDMQVHFYGETWAPSLPETMKILSWNAQGLGQHRALPIIFASNKIEELRVKLGFSGAFKVDCVGHIRGIVARWKNLNEVVMSKYNSNLITVEVMSKGHAIWRLSGFCGYPERSHRRLSWDLLAIYASSSLPWCCVGDYNVLLNSEDKKGCSDHPEWCF